MTLSLTNIVRKVNSLQKQGNTPFIKIGDIVCVKTRIKEGNKERLQQYEGTVISKKCNDIITIRRIFQNIGIEYNFPVFAPQIASIEIKRHSKVRRSKLYYLRNRIGKKAQLKNKISSVSF